MFEFLLDAGNYAERKVDRTDVNGLVVSTAYTSDEGYETAICDDDNVYPVERYDTKDLAMDGHLKWCEKAKTIETIIRLGAWNGLVNPREVTLKRKTIN